jgi:DNA-binding beta-propeller fold protein YncE
MKSSAMRKIFLGFAALAGVLLAGCGGGGATNVLTVTLSDSLGGVVVVTQADTITGTVTGPDTVNGVADVTVAFTCTFTTTTTTGTTTTTNKALPCPSDGSLGTLSNVQTTTVVYTAPPQLPDPTMFQGLIIIITGTADADKTKTGTFNLQLDSGIRVTIAPTSAAIALGEQKLFTANLTTDTVANDVTWGVTNTTVNTGGTPSIANTFNLNTPTCSPGCGSIDPSGNFTAPTTLPTNTTVQIFAISKKDTNRVAVATVTLVNGGVIVFNNLWPTIVPQGGSQADIFLNATNLTSQIGVTLNGQAIDAGSNAIKVFFTPSTLAATTGPVSTGARLRLNAQQLATPGTYTVTITPGSSTTQGTTPIATHTFQVVPVRPGLVSTLPNDISASAAGVTNQTVVLDGGYFGPLGSPIVGVNFNGSNVALPAPTSSEPRRLTGKIATAPSVGGQYSLSVTNSLDVTSPGTAFSNIAVLPAYANASTLTNPLTTTTLPFDTGSKIFAPCVPIAGQPACTTDANGNTFFRLCVPNPPTVTCSFPATISLGAASKPSAIAVDPVLNIGAVTEAGTDMVQFIDLGGPTGSVTQPTPPTLLGAFPTGPAGTPQWPTSVALDRNVCAKGTAADPTTGKCPAGGPFQNIAAVVNFRAQTLAVLTAPTGTLLETIPLNNLIPPSGGSTNTNTSPFPYSVGIDPFTHRAVVAFASTNAGFIVNLDPSQSPSICLPGFAPSDGTSYCPVALVELNTGNSPQIAFEPGAHLAFVTPGGAGSLTAVNTTNPSQASLKIASAQRTANIVTVTMAPNTPHNLVPGSEGTVLISGLPPGTAGSSFNGAFSLLSVINNLEFAYAQTGPNDTSTSTGGMQGFLSTATNFLTFSITPTVQGIDINPITHSAVLADPNASTAQITFVDSLDESVSSLNLCNGLNLSSATVPCTAEVGASAVAFQPFTNTVVSLNASLNQISLLDPSASQRVTIVPTGQTAATSLCFPDAPCAMSPVGAGATTVNLVGAVAVDPINNLALVVNSGSGTITPLYLANIQPLQIQSVSTPPVDATTGATNPAIISQTVLIDSATPTQSVSGIQIFGRGFTSATQVRLDGVPLPASDVVFSAAKPNELDVTIPRTNGTQNILTGPRNFGLGLTNPGGATSNVMDFRVVEAIKIPACAGVPAAPGAVAIADDLVGTGKNFAVVTETACSQAALISLNPDTTFATFSTIPTGKTPTGVATIPRFGFAVVANNSDGTASVLDLTKGIKAVATDVSVGTSPTGVAIEQETGLAIVTNTGSNTATVIDLTPLQLATPGTLAPLTTSTGSEPIAVAIDPDRGANATGLAVVTSVNIASSPASGQLDLVDLSVAAPSFNSVNTGTVGTTPTGIVFDPASPNHLFYAAESDNNAFVAFNPDILSATTVQVGINPASIAYNFQTSTILTVNSTSNTVSVVDSQTFQTKATLGIGGVSLFATAIEPLSNLALIVDQQNNRVLLFPLPH